MSDNYYRFEFFDVKRVCEVFAIHNLLLFIRNHKCSGPQPLTSNDS